jgi:predicted DNA-binding transcriptional regulator YafY
MTAGDLAGELEVSRRQILRDVDALSLAGIPVYSESGRGGGISLMEEYRTSLTGLNQFEVQSMMVMNNNHALREVGLGNAADQLLMKMLAGLPKSQRSTADHIRQRLLIDPTWWWHDPAMPTFWDDLQKAVYEDRLIEVTYENYNGEISEKVLAPYSLVCKSSQWYLLAEREGDLRTYRVNRFHSVHVLNRSFSRRDDFDLPEFWRIHLKSFEEEFSDHNYIFRVHPDHISTLKSLLPGRWKVTGDPDERGWLTISLNLDSDMMAKMMVFGLAGFVEVISPPELIDAISDQARFLLQANSKKEL